jgi:hypothetical protein
MSKNPWLLRASYPTIMEVRPTSHRPRTSNNDCASVRSDVVPAIEQTLRSRPFSLSFPRRWASALALLTASLFRPTTTVARTPSGMKANRPWDPSYRGFGSWATTTNLRSSLLPKMEVPLSAYPSTCMITCYQWSSVDSLNSHTHTHTLSLSLAPTSLPLCELVWKASCHF